MFKIQNGWTKKEMINQILTKNNGTRSQTEGGACLYRCDADGNACAVGCFIPDNLYHSSMEGDGVMRVLKNYPVLKEFMPLSGVGMTALQEEHDCVALTHEHLTRWIKENVEE